MNFKCLLLSILFVFLLFNTSQSFSLAENFSILPNEQKTIDVVLDNNQKIFFQIFVEGGDNNDIHLKITDNIHNYFNGIIRETKHNSDYPSPVFEAYKSEITNDAPQPKTLFFIFDNSLSTSNPKNVDFTYSITDSREIFEQPEFLSWIYSIIALVIIIGIVITVIVIIIKKLKQRDLDKN